MTGSSHTLNSVRLRIPARSGDAADRVALMQGLQSLRQRVGEESKRGPYDVYQQLDLGPGGYAIAPSTQTRRGVAAALRRKIRR